MLLYVNFVPPHGVAFFCIPFVISVHRGHVGGGASTTHASSSPSPEYGGGLFERNNSNISSVTADQQQQQQQQQLLPRQALPSVLPSGTSFDEGQGATYVKVSDMTL